MAGKPVSSGSQRLDVACPRRRSAIWARAMRTCKAGSRGMVRTIGPSRSGCCITFLLDPGDVDGGDGGAPLERGGGDLHDGGAGPNPHGGDQGVIDEAFLVAIVF